MSPLMMKLVGAALAAGVFVAAAMFPEVATELKMLGMGMLGALAPEVGRDTSFKDEL